MRLESHRQSPDQGFLLGDLFAKPEGVSVLGLRWLPVDVLDCRIADDNAALSAILAIWKRTKQDPLGNLRWY